MSDEAASLKGGPPTTARREGLGSKILIALLSAVFGLVGGYVLQTVGKKEPALIVTISAPNVQFADDRVQQFITIKNSGNDLSKQVRLVVRSVKARIYED